MRRRSRSRSEVPNTRAPSTAYSSVSAAMMSRPVWFDRLIRRVEQRQRKANLVAVAGALHRIKLVHRRLSSLGSKFSGLSSLGSNGARGGRVAESSRAATRLNNDADTNASQGLQNGKSRKPLPHCTHAACHAIALGSRGRERSRKLIQAFAIKRPASASGTIEGAAESRTRRLGVWKPWRLNRCETQRGVRHTIRNRLVRAGPAAGQLQLWPCRAVASGAVNRSRHRGPRRSGGLPAPCQI